MTKIILIFIIIFTCLSHGVLLPDKNEVVEINGLKRTILGHITGSLFKSKIRIKLNRPYYLQGQTILFTWRLNKNSSRGLGKYKKWEFLFCFRLHIKKNQI